MKMNSLEAWFVERNLRGRYLEQKELPFFLNLSPLEKKKTILEIGCGAGFGLVALHKTLKPAQLYAIDIDERLIELAKQRCKAYNNVTIKNASATELPFSSNMFDAIFVFAILHHVEDWQKASREIYDKLKPEGVFYFEEFTREALQNPCFKLFFEHPQENRFSAEEFIGEQIKIGFKEINYKQWFGSWGFRGVAKKGFT